MFTLSCFFCLTVPLLRLLGGLLVEEHSRGPCVRLASDGDAAAGARLPGQEEGGVALGVAQEIDKEGIQNG